MLTELPELIVGFAVGLAIMRAGHILLILRPRRFRQLAGAYEKLLEAHRTAKYDWKHQVAHANQEASRVKARLVNHRQQIAKVTELNGEVARLRKLNGETYQKYVRAQDRYEQLKEGRSPRI